MAPLPPSDQKSISVALKRRHTLFYFAVGGYFILGDAKKSLHIYKWFIKL